MLNHYTDITDIPISIDAKVNTKFNEIWNKYSHYERLMYEFDGQTIQLNILYPDDFASYSSMNLENTAEALEYLDQIDKQMAEVVENYGHITKLAITEIIN